MRNTLTKYEYIDGAITIPVRTGDLASITDFTTSPVTNLQVVPNVAWDGVTNITKLQVTWDGSSVLGRSDTYNLIWSNNNGIIHEVKDLSSPSYDIINPVAGRYVISVASIHGITKMAAAYVQVIYEYKLTGVSTLVPPINPHIAGTVALSSNSLTLNVAWDYDIANDSVVDSLLDYKVEIYDEAPTTVKATYSVKPNIGTKGGSFDLKYDEIQGIFGAKPRKITWRVYSRDTFGLLSATYSQFTTENPVPVAQSFSLTPLTKAVLVSIAATSDSDGVGYNIYTSLTSGGIRTLVYSGTERTVAIPCLETTPILNYYTVDAYDALGTTGLITSAEHSATALVTSANASDIINTTAGSIAATNVQAAINELDSEKESVANKVIAWSSPTNTQYPSAKLVKDTFTNYLPVSSYHEYYKGKFTTLAALNIAIPIASAGDYAQVDTGIADTVHNYNWDDETGWVIGSSGSGATNTDALPEGSTNFYFTENRVRATLLTGFSSLAGTVGATDSIITAFNKVVGNIATKIGLTSLSATSPISYNSSTGVFSIPVATTSANGYLSSTDWTTFNNKQAAFGSQTANFFYAAPNGSTGSPTFRAIVASDVPTLNQNTTGSAAKLTTIRTINGVNFDGTADITIIAEATHAATSKATPVDADELPIVDSASSNVLKKLTWTNLKATLKTYFDTLYAPAWQTWTPTWTNITIGNAVVNGRYFINPVNKKCTAYLDVTFGTTSTTNGSLQSLTLPVASVSRIVTAKLGDGTGLTTIYFPVTTTYKTAADVYLMLITVSGSATILASSAVAWSNTHKLSLKFEYETA
jgi:hypothetical protein